MPRKVRDRWMGDAKSSTGQRIRKMFDTEQEALAFEANPDAPLVRPTVAHVFRQGYALYWQRSKNRRDAYGITEELIKRLGADTLVSMVTTKVVQDLKLQLIQGGNSGARINRKMVALRKLLTFAKGQGYLTALPDFEKPEAEGKGRERFLTPAEADRVLGYLAPPYYEFARFLLYTGCRYGEAVALRWSDVQPGVVVFRWSTTKSSRSRSVPLAKPAAEALAFAPGKLGPWDCINYDEFHRRFKLAVTLAELDPQEIVPHTLRHTCASWLVQRGVSIRHVQKWLGHSSVVTTERYAKLLPEDLSSLPGVLDTRPDNSHADFNPLALPDGCQSATAYGNDHQSAKKFSQQGQRHGVPGECPERQRGRTVNPRR